MESNNALHGLFIQTNHVLKSIEDGSAIKGAGNPDAALDRFEAIAADLDGLGQPLLEIFFPNHCSVIGGATTEWLVQMLHGKIQVGECTVNARAWFCNEMLRRFALPEGLPTDIAPEDLFRVTGFLFGLMLRTELFRRQSENEDRNGALIRDLLVHKDDPENFTRFLKRAVHLSVWATPELPRSDAEFEKESLAETELVARLKNHWNGGPVGLSHHGLKALVDGEFNKLLWRVRDHVRGQLKTELRKQAVLITTDEEDKKEHAKVEYFQEWSSDKSEAFMERLFDSLTPRQRVFLELRLAYDSQAEVAAKMEITPAAASQLQSSIQKRIAKLLENEPLAEISRINQT